MLKSVTGNYIVLARIIFTVGDVISKQSVWIVHAQGASLQHTPSNLIMLFSGSPRILPSLLCPVAHCKQIKIRYSCIHDVYYPFL